MQIPLSLCAASENCLGAAVWKVIASVCIVLLESRMSELTREQKHGETISREGRTELWISIYTEEEIIDENLLLRLPYMFKTTAFTVCQNRGVLLHVFPASHNFFFGFVIFHRFV